MRPVFRCPLPSLFFWLVIPRVCGLTQLLQKTLTRNEFQSKVIGNCLPDVGKGVSSSEIDSSCLPSVNQKRSVLACVIGSRKCWIVSMVGCDHHQIVVAHC